MDACFHTSGGLSLLFWGNSPAKHTDIKHLDNMFSNNQAAVSTLINTQKGMNVSNYFNHKTGDPIKSQRNDIDLFSILYDISENEKM